MKRLAWLVLLHVAAPAQAQSVFKCTAPDGAVSIQQMPCPGAGTLLEVRPNRAPLPPAPAQTARAPAQQYSAETAAAADKRAVDIAAGMSAGYPVVGMTTSQLAHAMGPPSRVYAEDFGTGPRERRVYRRGIRTHVIVVEGGKVTSIQQSADADRAPASRARSCASDIEMRNLETEAASIGTSDPRRREIDRRLRAMRDACR